MMHGCARGGGGAHNLNPNPYPHPNPQSLTFKHDRWKVLDELGKPAVLAALMAILRGRDYQLRVLPATHLCLNIEGCGFGSGFGFTV